MQTLSPSLLYDARTHQGRVRDHNEDAFGTPARFGIPTDRCAVQGTLLVVCDGMGGRAAGEEASRLAVATIYERFYADPQPDRRSALESAILAANEAVFTAGQNDPQLAGMGTTVVALLFLAERVLVAHAGDSRAYLLRDGALAPLTIDHTWVAEGVAAGLFTAEEAANHPYRHALTRAAGLDASLKSTVADWQPVAPGDRYLLCSDGLTNEVPAEGLASLLMRRNAAQALVKQAHRAGGHDNITALIAVVLDEGESRVVSHSIRTPLVVLGMFLLAVVAVAGYLLARNFAPAAPLPAAAPEVRAAAATLPPPTPFRPELTSTLAPTITPEPTPTSTHTATPTYTVTATPTRPAPTATNTGAPGRLKTGDRCMKAASQWCPSYWPAIFTTSDLAIIESKKLRLDCARQYGVFRCSTKPDSLLLDMPTTGHQEPETPPGVMSGWSPAGEGLPVGTQHVLWFHVSGKWLPLLATGDVGPIRERKYTLVNPEFQPDVPTQPFVWLAELTLDSNCWTADLYGGQWVETAGLYTFTPDPAYVLVSRPWCSFTFVK